MNGYFLNTRMDPEITNWQEAWELEAKRTADVFSAWTDEELLEWITRRGTDSYYTVWEEIGRRKNPGLFAEPLARVIADKSTSSLVRTHATMALESTLKETK